MATRIGQPRRPVGQQRFEVSAGTVKPVQVTSLIFLIVAIPILFCMITWVAATAYRLYFPEKPLPLERELAFISRLDSAPKSDLPVPIGVRQIKENERRRRSVRAERYDFDRGISNGLPSDWLDDLWQRRN